MREANVKEERDLHLQHQLAEIGQYLGAGEDKSYQNCMLGGPLDLEGRECELLAAPDRELASKQQTDTTIGMQLCSFGIIAAPRESQNYRIVF